MSFELAPDLKQDLFNGGTESYLYAACEIIPAALWRGAHMKYLLVSLLLVTVVWAEKVPNEADYPTEYQVVTTSARSGGLMLGNFCTRV